MNLNVLDGSLQRINGCLFEFIKPLALYFCLPDPQKQDNIVWKCVCVLTVVGSQQP